MRNATAARAGTSLITAALPQSVGWMHFRPVLRTSCRLVASRYSLPQVLLTAWGSHFGSLGVYRERNTSADQHPQYKVHLSPSWLAFYAGTIRYPPRAPTNGFRTTHYVMGPDRARSGSPAAPARRAARARAYAVWSLALQKHPLHLRRPPPTTRRVGRFVIIATTTLMGNDHVLSLRTQD